MPLFYWMRDILWYWWVCACCKSIWGSQLFCFYCHYLSPAWFLLSLTRQVRLKMRYWSSPSSFFVCSLANISAGNWALTAVCLVTLPSVVSLRCFWKTLVWFLFERWLAHKCVPTHLIILLSNLSSGFFLLYSFKRKKAQMPSFYPWKQRSSCSAECCSYWSLLFPLSSFILELSYKLFKTRVFLFCIFAGSFTWVF